MTRKTDQMAAFKRALHKMPLDLAATALTVRMQELLTGCPQAVCSSAVLMVMADVLRIGSAEDVEYHCKKLREIHAAMAAQKGKPACDAP